MIPQQQQHRRSRRQRQRLVVLLTSTLLLCCQRSLWLLVIPNAITVVVVAADAVADAAAAAAGDLEHSKEKNDSSFSGSGRREDDNSNNDNDILSPEVADLLEAHRNMMEQVEESVTAAGNLVKNVDSFIEEETSAEMIQSLPAEVEELLNHVNAMQLAELSDRLSAAERAELDQRERLNEQDILMQRMQLAEEKLQELAAVDTSVFLKKDRLESEIRAEKLWGPSEDTFLKDWILQLIQDEFHERYDEMELPVIEDDDDDDDDDEDYSEDYDDDYHDDYDDDGEDGGGYVERDDDDRHPASLRREGESQCITAERAIHEIQQALSNFSTDGIGLDDILQPLPMSGERNDGGGSSGGGGSIRRRRPVIVHSMTSPTYAGGAAKESELLGNVWWRKFIPEDWEESVLPDGWEEWDTRKLTSLFRPEAFFGLGGDAAASSTSTSTSTSSSLLPLPPETIWNPHALPGSCWPMRGRKGHVTFKLPEPVHIDAVSIDHVSSALLSDPEQQRKSAPRDVVVYGFPPCGGVQAGNGTATDCDGLDFYSERKFPLTRFQYDLHGPAVQTFHVDGAGDGEGGATAKASRGSGDVVDYDDDDEYLSEDADDDNADRVYRDKRSRSSSSSSCSAASTEPSCSGLQPPELLAAVQIEIIDNWGNGDYTCLYRVRVHGKPITP